MPIIDITDRNPVTIGAFKRAQLRHELAEMWGAIPVEGLSATVSLQVLTTALNAIDAIDRIEELADKLNPGKGTSLDVIGHAIATEIRNALEGK